MLFRKCLKFILQKLCSSKIVEQKILALFTTECSTVFLDLQLQIARKVLGSIDQELKGRFTYLAYCSAMHPHPAIQKAATHFLHDLGKVELVNLQPVLISG
jgi:hypothetical protein